MATVIGIGKIKSSSSLLGLLVDVLLLSLIGACWCCLSLLFDVVCRGGSFFVGWLFDCCVHLQLTDSPFTTIPTDEPINSACQRDHRVTKAYIASVGLSKQLRSRLALVRFLCRCWLLHLLQLTLFVFYLLSLNLPSNQTRENISEATWYFQVVVSLTCYGLLLHVDRALII